MDWIKIPIDCILHSDFKNSELLALIKYQALYCQLETEPSEVQLSRVLNQKELKFVLSCSEVAIELIQSQIKTVKSKRKRDKDRYAKKQEVNLNSASEPPANRELSAVTDKIRLDKIRIEKKYKKDFETFYFLYPRKIDPKKALEKWNVAIKKSSIDEIMAGLERYNAYLQADKTDKKFIKHPATWLNNACWDNDYTIEVKEEGFNVKEYLQELEANEAENG